MSTYQTKCSHPRTLPFATIYIGGLLCLSFDNAKGCTVGVNKEDSDHKWKFVVQEKGAGSPLVQHAWNATDPHVDRRPFEIVVTGGTTGGAYVYTGGSVAIDSTTKNRFNLEDSWVDLEGERGHGIGVKNDNNKLYPRFSINDGLFCAYRLSTGWFNLKDGHAGSEAKKIDKVALAVAADIFLDTSAGSQIEIKHPGGSQILNDKSKEYQIFITNNCPPSTTKPIDFDLHYKAFLGAFGNPADHFKLEYQTGSPIGNDDPIFPLLGDDEYPLTDRAPCMTATVGQTSVFK